VKLSDAEFQMRVEDTLKDLEFAFSRLANERDIDVEMQGNVLTVTFEEGEPGKFVISPNSSVGQIWVSARLASYKFDWSDTANDFILPQSNELIKTVLERLTREQLGDDSVSL
jgi:iron donor protein CyaY